MKYSVGTFLVAILCLKSIGLSAKTSPKLNVHWMDISRNPDEIDRTFRTELIPTLEKQVDCEKCPADLLARYRKTFLNELRVWHVSLRSENSNDAIVAMYAGGSYNCHKNRWFVFGMSPGPGEKPKRIFMKTISIGNGDLGTNNGIGTLSIPGQSFLSVISPWHVEGAEDVANYGQHLFIWDGVQFKDIFGVRSQYQTVCGTGPSGGYRAGKVGELEGHLFLFEWNMPEIGNGASNKTEDVRINKTELNWDTAKQKISKGASEFVSRDAIDLGF